MIKSLLKLFNLDSFTKYRVDKNTNSILTNLPE